MISLVARRSVFLLFFTVASSHLSPNLCGQAVSSAKSGGIRSSWDLSKTLDSLIANCNRLRPVVEKVTPRDWMSKGAPQGYVDQHQLVLSQLRSVAYVSQQLAKDPEKLSLALDLFMRLESLELNLQSFAEGARNYQNPAVAELIEGMRGEGASARSGLRDYVVELASAKEQEFKIVDNEAQKCRAQQLRSPKRR